MGMFGSALKKIATPENLYLLGATLKDIGDPGANNFLGAQQMMQGRRDKSEKEAKEARQLQLQSEMIQKLFGGQQPGSQAIVGAGSGAVANAGEYGGIGPGMDGSPMGGRKPGLFGGQRASSVPTMQQAAPILAQLAATGLPVGDYTSLLKAAQPDPSRYIEGPDGIYEVGAEGPKLVKSYPAKPNTTPGQINPATGQWEWAPGYVAAQGALTGARRDAVVSRPTPSRARAGGSGRSGGSQKLPPGFILD